MNLAQAKSLTKSTAIIGTIILIIVVLLGLIYLRFKKTPIPISVASPVPSPSFHQTPGQKQPASFDIQIGQQAHLPKKLSTFQAKPAIITETTAQTIAQALGITSKPPLIEKTADGEQYSWQDKNATLTISQAQIRYKNFLTPKENTQNLENLKNSAYSFVQRIPTLDKTATIDTKKTKYLTISSSHLVSANSLEDAAFVEFLFSKNLEGIPVITNYPDTNYLTLGINKDGALVYIYARLFQNLTQQSSYPIKTQEEALQDLKQGKGIIIQTSLPESIGSIGINEVKVTNMELAYFLPDKSDEIIQPVFVFSGNFKYKDKEGKMVIYLPAIK